VPLEVNATPAMLIVYPRSRHLLVLDVDADAIRRTFVLANPDKLGAVPGLPEVPWAALSGEVPTPG
jgi:hypothetical protein